jgi:hypothetical protein
VAGRSIDTDALAVPVASRRALVAACVGNVVEWYDFAIFGALGVVLVPVFPSEQGADLLLAAFAVCTTAFLARPTDGCVVAHRDPCPRCGVGFAVGGLILLTTSGDDSTGWWRIAFLAALPLGARRCVRATTGGRHAVLRPR